MNIRAILFHLLLSMASAFPATIELSTATDEQKSGIRAALGLPSSGTLPTLAGLPFIDASKAPYSAVGDGVANDTAAIQSALTAAASNTVTRTVYLPPGTYKGNWTIPPNVNLIGWGTALDGLDPALQIVTRLIPQSDASPVIFLPIAASNRISDFHIECNPSTVQGIKVGDAATFAGISAKFSRIRVKGGLVGVEASFCVGILFEHVHCNYNGWGWRFRNLADTCQLISCGANYFTSGALDLVNSVHAGSVRSLMIWGGEWGNGTGPWIEASSSSCQIVAMGCNVESIDHDYIIRTDFVSMQLDSIRMDVASANPDQVSFIRQVGPAQVSIVNPIWASGSPGYLWEGVDGTKPPNVVGLDAGVLRFSPTSAFASTTRTLTVAKYRSPGVLAYRTTGQTIPTGAATAVTWDAEVGDDGYFTPATGLFTAPSAGWYQITVSIFMTETNAGYTRVVEMVDGAAAAVIANGNNIGAYHQLNGSCARYLNAGQTYGVGILHDKGSSMTIYGGSGTETFITINRVSH